MKKITEKINQYIQNNAKLAYFLLYLSALVPKIYIALKMVPLRTPNDELGTIVSAAELAGNSWGEVVASLTNYYGFGFYWAFFPVFLITDNPVVIYRTILVICSMMQAGIAPLALYIQKKYLGMKDEDTLIAAVIGWICSFLVVTRVTILYNEHALIMISWLMMLLICKLMEAQEQKKDKIITTLLIVGLLIYSLTIHVRALVYSISFLLVLCLYWIITKKKLINWLGVPVYIFAYFIMQKVISVFQSIIWRRGEGEYLHNAEIKTNFSQAMADSSGVNGISRFGAALKTFFNIWIGQIDTISVFSGGLFFVSVLSLLIFTCKCIKKKENSRTNGTILVTAWTMLFAIGGTIFAQSLTWFQPVYSGILYEDVNTYVYAYKTFAYVRYIGPYIGPLLLCGLVLCYNNSEILKKMRYALIVIMLAGIGYWFLAINPYVWDQTNTKEVYTAFSSLSKFQVSEDGRAYVCGFIVLIIFSILWLRGTTKKNFYVACIMTVFLLGYQYWHRGMYYDLYHASKDIESYDDIYKFICEEKDLLEKENIEQIYCIGTEDSLICKLQFYLNRFSIIPIDGKVPENAEIIVSTEALDEEIEDLPFCEIQLDSAEYIYLSEELRRKQ